LEKGNLIAGMLSGLIAYTLGLPYELLILWGMLMIVDILTGIIMSAKNGEWSSRQMKNGLFKKTAELFMMFSLLLIQRVVIISGINIPIGDVLVGVFCFKEFGSIVENYVAMGNKLPKLIENWFKVTKNKIEEE
jgi:toxin secretion/phage lysis holin